jgi:hypothetical protein
MIIFPGTVVQIWASKVVLTNNPNFVVFRDQFKEVGDLVEVTNVISSIGDYKYWLTAYSSFKFE